MGSDPRWKRELSLLMPSLWREGSDPISPRLRFFANLDPSGRSHCSGSCARIAATVATFLILENPALRPNVASSSEPSVWDEGLRRGPRRPRAEAHVLWLRARGLRFRGRATRLRAAGANVSA